MIGVARSPVMARRAVCSGCGRPGSSAAAIADLAVQWLAPGPDRTPAARRFCYGCAPRGPVEEVVCVRCGDGPLLSGELTAMDLQVTAAVDGWLAEAGWRLVGPVCPDCVGELGR